MRAVILAAAVVLAGCDVASSALGRDAMLQVDGAQWRPGPRPDDDGGPTVSEVLLRRPTVVRDGLGQRVTGALAPSATGLWLGADGDVGGWIVTADAPSVERPGDPSFAVDLAVTAAARLGSLALDAVAVDASGRAGPVLTTAILVEDAPPPTGELVVALAWDGRADLDLHVIAPDGGEAWSGDPNTWEPPPPGTPIDPLAWRTGGLLDHDGNAGCRRDARPSEHVVWSVPPPAGRYVVRVDTRALCGDAVAYYAVALYRQGALLASASGVATSDDALGAHGAGAGVTLLDVVVP